jgi:micrococcal nuclease
MKVIFVLLLIFNNVIKAQTVKVVGIADGDTFTALFADNHTERIRLHGIDCPETGQPFGKAAKQFTSSLIFQKKVFLIKKEIDRYGRTIAIVKLPGNITLQEELLKAGLAWHYVYFDKNTEWSKLEGMARTQHTGLWNDKNQVAPWEWRKQKRTVKKMFYELTIQDL